HEHLWLVLLDANKFRYATNTCYKNNKKGTHLECVSVSVSHTVYIGGLCGKQKARGMDGLCRHINHGHLFCRHVAHGQKEIGELDLLDYRRYYFGAFIFLQRAYLYVVSIFSIHNHCHLWL